MRRVMAVISFALMVLVSNVSFNPSESVSAAGPTYVSGLITSDTTWTSSNSPYIVTSDITLQTGKTLTIENCTVKFDNETTFRIRGTMIAKNSTFTANGSMYKYNFQGFIATGNKYNIIIDTSQGGIGLVTNCTFEHSTSERHVISFGWGGEKQNILSKSTFKKNLFGLSGGVKVDTCLFENNYIGANCYSYLNNSLFINNYYGIQSNGSGPKVNVCTFTGNEFGAYSEWGAEYNYCNFSGNVRGIDLWNQASQSTVAFCQFINNTQGIYSRGITIRNNTIENNEIGITTMQCIINNNSVMNNDVGIWVVSGYSFQDNDLKIRDNNICNNSNYNLNLSQSYDCIAKFNWWGNTNTDTINQSIYDIYDDVSIGEVIYTPFLKSPIVFSNNPPVAHAGADQNVTVNQTVVFDGGMSYDPDWDKLSYKWDFGDGDLTEWLAVSDASHSYTAPGIYTVGLTVYDGVLSDVDTCVIEVVDPVPSNLPPVANAGDDIETMSTHPVLFDGRNSSDPEGDPLSYRWSFGDGTATYWQIDSTAIHVFDSPGEYVATLNVSDGIYYDSDSCAIYVSEIEIINSPPVANAGPDQNATVGEIVHFDGSLSADPDKDSLSFNWDFGDGTTSGYSANSNGSHSYAQPGNYTVILNATDGLLFDTSSCYVQISDETSIIDDEKPDITNNGTIVNETDNGTELPNDGTDDINDIIDNLDDIDDAINSGLVGLEMSIDEHGNSEIKTHVENLYMNLINLDSLSLELNIDGESEHGLIIIVNIHPDCIFNIALSERIDATFDGIDMLSVHTTTVLSARGDDAVYSKSTSGEGIQMMVYIPHFSEHKIIFEKIVKHENTVEETNNQTVVTGSMLVILLIAILIIIFAFILKRRGEKKEHDSSTLDEEPKEAPQPIPTITIAAGKEYQNIQPSTSVAGLGAEQAGLPPVNSNSDTLLLPRPAVQPTDKKVTGTATNNGVAILPMATPRLSGPTIVNIQNELREIIENDESINSKQEWQSLLETKYQQGEVTQETFNSLRNDIENLEE